MMDWMQQSKDTINKVAFVSLGCPKNLVDSERMLGALSADGLELVSDHDSADAVVINTCGFLDAAREESLEVIHEAIDRKNSGRIDRVVVTGCLVQRHRAKLLDWAPGIDAMIGVFDRDRISQAVRGDRPGRRSLEDDDQPPYWIAGNALQAARERGMQTIGLTVNGADGNGIGYFEDDGDRFRLTPRHWAYLRMSEGCNQKCAFCTIPSIRGKMRSKPMEQLLAEARALCDDGVFEINLIGQDTTSYGMDIGEDGPGMGLSGLLDSLDRLMGEHGGGWIRLMYAYPTRFTDEMIQSIADLTNVVPYIDIPLQHCADGVLNRMRRNINGASQMQLLEKLRDRVPGMAIRTTMITGFPGETDQEHRQLVQFIRDFQFDALGVFRYSHEPGTPAATMEQDPDLAVPEDVKRQREEELMLAQQEIAFENAEYVASEGSIFDVLIDEPADPATIQRLGTDQPHVYIGRCYHQAPRVDSITMVTSREPLSPGELIRCRIHDSCEYDLVGSPLDQVDSPTSLKVLGNTGPGNCS